MAKAKANSAFMKPLKVSEALAFVLFILELVS